MIKICNGFEKVDVQYTNITKVSISYMYLAEIKQKALKNDQQNKRYWNYFTFYG